MIRSETISPATYSSLPWPKGCSSSASLPESLKKIRVTTEDVTSDRLFKASENTAMEPLSTPAIILKMTRIILKAMPNAPLSIP